MIITTLAFCISVMMSFLADLLLDNVSIIFMFIILIVIIFIGIIFDILGMAVTIAEEKPFHSMASSKLKGAKSSLLLIRNASRVSNICCDVVGDICGIISGTSAAYIILQISILASGSALVAFFSVTMSGFVAALTIGGKAIGKDIAVNNAKEILLACGRFVSLFTEK